MQPLFIPLCDFVRGILKRFWVWIIAILLDPFDIFEHWLSPHLPDDAQRFVEERLDMVLDYGLWVFLALFGWAAFLTYREVHQKARVELKLSMSTYAMHALAGGGIAFVPELTLSNQSKQYPVGIKTIELVIEPKDGQAFSIRASSQERIEKIKWRGTAPAVDLMEKNPLLSPGGVIRRHVVFEFNEANAQERKGDVTTVMVVDNFDKQYRIALATRSLSWP